MDRLLIKNAMVVTQDDLLIDRDVLIEDGHIASLNYKGDEANLPSIDISGKYLAPGFIDLHTHGRLMADTMDNKRGSLVKIAQDLLRHGVTGFLITTRAMPLEYTIEVIKTAVEYIKDPDPNGALPLGIYLEGPYLADAKKGAQTLDNEDKISSEGIKAMLEAGEGHIKVVALAPELKGAGEIISYLKEKGVTVSAAHTMCEYEETESAIDEGISLATHCFNAMKSIDHKNPGVITACLLDERVTCEAIVDGHHLHPAIVRLLYKTKGSDKVALISDSVAACGIPDGDYDYDGRQFSIKDGTVKTADGGLAGSLLSLDKAVANVINFSCCGLPEACKMASLTPAKVIKAEDRKGSVTEGKDADLVVLDEKLKVSAVFVSGKYYSFD